MAAARGDVVVVVNTTVWVDYLNGVSTPEMSAVRDWIRSITKISGTK